MEWYLVLAIILGSLLLLMITGLQVGFCFLLITLVGVAILWGPDKGLPQLTVSMFNASCSFVFVTIPMYILMGEILFHSGIAAEAISIVDKWLGAIPGRLALLSMTCGTIFAALCGASMASAAMLGESILPEMNKRGYKNTISIGSIIGAGGLAMMIPPSDQAVIWAAVADVSVGKILIALIIPGLLLASLCATYVVGRCWLQPSLAPSYAVDHTPFGAKIRDTIKYAFPVVIIILLVTGFVFLGIATPSEAAALGAAGSVLVTALYKRLNKKIFWTAVMGAVRITGMLMLVLVTSKGFSMILAYTGATRQLAELAMSSHLQPMIVVIGMMLVVTFLGCFMATVPIMMITLPIFMPIINGLHLDPIWFGIMFLINCEMGAITPPLGMMLFVAKAVVPKEVTMGEIINAAMPYIFIDILAIALIMIFPGIVTWLPGLMPKKI